MTDSPAFPSNLNLRTKATTGEAAFGLNVLEHLIEPLQRAATSRRSSRAWGPGVLGCTMWMDDPELIKVLKQMSNVCIVVTKQPHRRYADPRTDALKELARSNGLMQSAYSELFDLAPSTDGKPERIDPYHPAWYDNEIPAVREVGFRKMGDHLVPIVHAKILLLGQMHWHDEHPTGHITDIHWFRPERLWIGSANFTRSSRESLEMGMWTTDQDLMTAARQWLLSLVAISEPLGAGPDSLTPEFLPVEYDNDAFFEYLRDIDPPLRR